MHEFDKVELFAYTTPEGALEAQADILQRAESMLQELELPYRVLDLCCGDLGGPSARTFDLEVYAPGVDRWLEVSSVSWFRDYQARRANVRFRPAGGGPLQLVHTVNGSALAWPRIWAALVENGRQEDGTVLLPECLAPYLGGELLIKAPCDGHRTSRGAGRPSTSASATRLETIAAESRRLADTVAALDLEARVPSTPKWSVRDLAHHIGEVQWYWGQNVLAQNAAERSGAELTAFPEDSDLLAWLGWCTYSLLGALREVGPDAPCWTWWPEPHTAGAVGRHQAQEASVHRWDAEGVTGASAPLHARAGRRRGARVHRDHGGVRPGLAAGRRHADRHRHRGELAGRRRPAGERAGRVSELRATASDLVLMLYRRLPGPRRRRGGRPGAGGGAALAGRHR